MKKRIGKKTSKATEETSVPAGQKVDMSGMPKKNMVTSEHVAASATPKVDPDIAFKHSLTPTPPKSNVEAVVFAGVGTHLLEVPGEDGVSKTVSVEFTQESGWKKKITDPALIKVMRGKGYKEAS